MQTKTCSICRQDKPLEKFGKRSDLYREGKPTASCNACKAAKHREKYKNDSDYQQRQKGWAKTSHQKRKAAVIEAYGGLCACCGETEPDFLTIDHVNGDGADKRRSGEGFGGVLYAYLIRHNFPKDNYQLLCFNCNCSKRQFGVCPHKRRE